MEPIQLANVTAVIFTGGFFCFLYNRLDLIHGKLTERPKKTFTMRNDEQIAIVPMEGHDEFS
jgi:hypothetical protein